MRLPALTDMLSYWHSRSHFAQLSRCVGKQPPCVVSLCGSHKARVQHRKHIKQCTTCLGRPHMSFITGADIISSLQAALVAALVAAAVGSSGDAPPLPAVEQCSEAQGERAQLTCHTPRLPSAP